MFKTFHYIIFLLILSVRAYAQIIEPVEWKISLNAKGEIVFEATIDKGWHIYDMDLPEGSVIPTSFDFGKISGAELIGTVVSQSSVIKKFDPMFGVELRWFDHSAIFTQKIRVTDPERFEIAGSATYMACNDETCLSPTTEEFWLDKSDLPEALAQSARGKASSPILQPVEEPTDSTGSAPIEEQTATVITSIPDVETDLWAPVVDQLNAYGAAQSTSDGSWLAVMLAGFIGGLLALLTPCVWPMIPMTVSFFLKRSKTDRKKAVADALVYGASIIIIYLILGLLITILFGASALNELSTSALFNLLFFALLVVFAVSFFGAFELTLPASWTTKLDKKADSTTGLISIFFMAFTLVLVSFSCTGPIIGTLLVEAASQGNLAGPAVGMFGFALALSIPFALFAVFPSWLEKMPKSGGWLNSVKVVLGFLELALALKFLSVADQAYGWRILDREVFLVLWIVLFGLLGIYLLGKITFAHDDDRPRLSVPRLFLAIISLSFALYMVPGLWGAPLKAVSAFSPPLRTQDFNLYHGETLPKSFDYDSGMKHAKDNNKPALIDFTGHGCVNCREMETAVWSDPRVKQIIDNDYTLISLYVDDKLRLPQEIQIEESGKIRKLRTIGDQWSYLQRSKFGSNAQPFYVALDAEGIPLGPAYAYDKNIDHFISFLKRGITEYKLRSGN